MKVYLDHAATTPPFPEVIEAMADCMHNVYGNPSSQHSFGRNAHALLDIAREKIAVLIGADDVDEIFFTSGGTEADNLAILGTMENFPAGSHVITSLVEHHAVLDAFRYLEKQRGFDVTYLPVDSNGMIKIEDFRRALRDDTRLVSIMHANNEVGTIQPVMQIGQMLKGHSTLFHVDAVQSVGKILVDVNKFHCDMLTCSSHKINGPKGVGALYVRQGTSINRRAFGGGQEHALRSGTENVPGIVGFGLAAEITAKQWHEKAAHTAEMVAYLKECIQDIPNISFNGHPVMRLPHNLHISIPYIEGESLLFHLDLKGIAVSSGSACTSGAGEDSHVLLAMGLPKERLQCAVRITLGYGNSMDQMDYVAGYLKEKSSLLLLNSPLYQPFYQR